MMLSSQPATEDGDEDEGRDGDEAAYHWEMDVLGEWVRPEEVAQGGNEHVSGSHLDRSL